MHARIDFLLAWWPFQQGTICSLNDGLFSQANLRERPGQVQRTDR